MVIENQQMDGSKTRLTFRQNRSSANTSRVTTDGDAVYAIGDIHGCYDLLRDLLARITADQSASNFPRPAKLIFLGDYVDRGPASALVLEALCWIKDRPDIQSYMLMGNHEQGLLNFVYGTGDALGWLRWGGAQTLASYGVSPPDPAGPSDAIKLARQALLRNMPASHLELLMSLELITAVGSYVFVHAGLRPNVALKDQSEQDLLWIRDDFIRSKSAFEKIVVHGHTWVDDMPQHLSHRIGVDTGAYETGVLTAVRLYGAEVDFLHVGERKPPKA